MPAAAAVVTTVAGTHGDSDGVALPLAVRLAVTDGDAREAVREADRDALPLREKLPDAEREREPEEDDESDTITLALALAVRLPDGATPEREPDIVAVFVGDVELDVDVDADDDCGGSHMQHVHKLQESQVKSFSSAVGYAAAQYSFPK